MFVSPQFLKCRRQRLPYALVDNGVSIYVSQDKYLFYVTVIEWMAFVVEQKVCQR